LFAATHPATGPPELPLGGAPFALAPSRSERGLPLGGALAVPGPAGATPVAAAVAAAAAHTPGSPPGTSGAGSGGFQLGSGGGAPLLLLLLLALLVGLFKLAAPRGARLVSLASLLPARVTVAPLERPG
jgi:hypothetical protein